MFRIFTLLAFCLSFVPTSANTMSINWTVEPLRQESCVSNLQVGEQGEVVWPTNTMYDQPTTYPSNILAEIPHGGLFEVVGGPSCEDADGVWLEVVYNGIRGWLRETIYSYCEAAGGCSSLIVRRPLKPLQTAVPAPGTNPLFPVSPPPIDPNAISLTNVEQVAPLKIIGGGFIQGFTWSPDERQIAVASSVDVKIYNVGQLNTAAHSLSQFDGIVDNAVYSPDGRFLAVGDSAGTVSLWDTNSYEVAGQLNLEGAVEDVAFSADGQQIAVAVKPLGVQVWNIADTAHPVLVRQFEGRGGSVRFIGESSQVVNVDVDGYGVGILNPDIGEAHYLTEGFDPNTVTKSINWWTISPDGRYTAVIIAIEMGTDGFSMSYAYQLFGWNTETGEHVVINRDFSGPSGQWFNLQFNPTGENLLLSQGGEQYFYGISQDTFGSLNIPGSTSAAYSLDGSLLAVGLETGAVQLYLQYQLQDTLDGIDAPVGSLRFSPNANYLAAWGGNALHVWELQSRQQVGVVQFESQRIGTEFFVLNADESQIITSNTSVWDTATGAWIQNVPQVSWPPSVLRADGLFVSSANTSEGTTPFKLVVKNLYTGEIIREIPVATDNSFAIYFNRDGNLSAYFGKRYDQYFAQVVDLNTGQPVRTLEQIFEELQEVLFSPDSRLLATFDMIPTADSGRQMRVLIWEISTGYLLGHYLLSDSFAMDAIYSPNSTKLAWLGQKPNTPFDSDEYQLHILNLTDGSESIYDIPFDQSYQMVFSADASLVMLGDKQGNIHLWNSDTGQEVTSLSGHTGAITQLTLSRDGTRLYSAGKDGRLYVWGVAGQ